ncbi:MAG: flagellar biosynthesis anti-sigma factor FlgM [Turicibacter sp.]|nr:flagellar biosynthesis anti-sigma factor FlgM [Turicibacter sp.]
MEIRELRIDNAYRAYNAYNTAAHTKTKPTTSHRPSTDTFSLSHHAEDYQTARRALASLPDIREDKVASLRHLIQSNQYNIPSSAIAEKILQSPIH